MSKRREEGFYSKSIASFMSVYPSYGYQASKVSLKNLVPMALSAKLLLMKDAEVKP